MESFNIGQRAAAMQAVYATLVIAVLGITPLWLDELQQAGPGRESISALLEWVRMNPGASPLPYLVQRAAVHLAGPAAFVCRIPAALCSILAAVALPGLCARLQVRSRLAGLAMFMALPLQFRYAIEARGYSQGLLFAVLSLLAILRLRDRPTLGRAFLYAAAVALGLYSQPLVVVVVAGEIAWIVRPRAAAPRAGVLACAAAALAGLSFAPWYISQRAAQAGMAWPYSFSLKQLTPQALLHGISGGGYLSTAPLLFLAVIGCVAGGKRDDRGLVAYTVLAALIGPIAIDALVDYFFAARQLLFATPALVLAAAFGIDRLRERGHARAAFTALLVFFAASAYSDFRLATVPKDSLAGDAASLAAHLPPDACIALAPPNHSVYYYYLQPQLESRFCAPPPSSPVVLLVASPYSTAEDRARWLRSLGRYTVAGTAKIGSMDVPVYRLR